MFEPYIFHFEIEGLSRLAWSKRIPKCPSKTDQREWEESHARARFHTDDDGNVCIPSMAVKNGLTAIARYLSEKIGKGHATYTKHFRSGVQVLGADFPLLPATKPDDLHVEWLDLPSNPSSQSGARVEKLMPYLPTWKTQGDLLVVDATITEAIMTRYFQELGQLIGLGRFRPENGGFYGRFKLETHTVESYKTRAA